MLCIERLSSWCLFFINSKRLIKLCIKSMCQLTSTTKYPPEKFKSFACVLCINRRKVFKMLFIEIAFAA